MVVVPRNRHHFEMYCLLANEITMLIVSPNSIFQNDNAGLAQLVERYLAKV